MKNNYLLTLLCLSMAVQLNSQIANGGFENWSNLPGYAVPVVAPSDFTSTDSELFLSSDTPAVSEVMGEEGSGMRIESYLLGEDTIGGFAIWGNVPEGDDLVFSGGFPFFEMGVTGITLDMRYDISPDSPGFILIQFLNGGVPVTGGPDDGGTYFFEFSGMQPDWQSVTFDFTDFPLSEAPDECVIALACNNVIDENGIPGNWLEVDNLMLNGVMGQVPGGNLNTWEDIDGPLVLDDWETIYPPGIGLIYQSDISVEGDYSVQLQTESFDGESVQSMIYLGEATEEFISPNQPIPAGSTSISFQYQFQEQGGLDTATVYFLFSEVENPLPFEVTFNTTSLMPTLGWTEIVIDFAELGIDPEFFAVIFMSGPGFDQMGLPGSTLWLDALQINGLGGCDYTATIEEGDVELCPGETLELSTQLYDSYVWYAAEESEGEFFDFAEGENTIFEEGAESGVFEIFVQVSLDGCTTNSDTITVEVAETAIPEISGPTELCFGETIMLSVDNADEFDTFQWVIEGFDVLIGGTSSDLGYIGIAEGTFEVWVETTDGGDTCPGAFAQSEAIMVTTHLPPEPSVMLAVNTLSTQSYESYQWYFNGNEIEGATSQNFEAETNGAYYVTVTDENGCTGESDTYDFIFDGVPSLSSSISVYPNPAEDQLNIDGIETGMATIYNMIGEKVWENGMAQSFSSTIDISTLPVGAYVLRISSANVEFSKVFTKE